MRWESTKFYVICDSQAEIEKDNLRIHKGGGEIQKIMKATYPEMTMSSRGIRENKNLERVKGAVLKANPIAIAAVLDTNNKIGSTSHLLDTFLGSKYTYNAIFLNNTEPLTELD